MKYGFAHKPFIALTITHLLYIANLIQCQLRGKKKKKSSPGLEVKTDKQVHTSAATHRHVILGITSPTKSGNIVPYEGICRNL